MSNAHRSSEVLFDNLKMALTYGELSQRIGLSELALRKMVQRRQIPYVKIGSRVRFIPEDIAVWLKERGVTHVS